MLVDARELRTSVGTAVEISRMLPGNRPKKVGTGATRQYSNAKSIYVLYLKSLESFDVQASSVSPLPVRMYHVPPTRRAKSLNNNSSSWPDVPCAGGTDGLFHSALIHLREPSVSLVVFPLLEVVRRSPPPMEHPILDDDGFRRHAWRRRDRRNTIPVHGRCGASRERSVINAMLSKDNEP